MATTAWKKRRKRRNRRDQTHKQKNLIRHRALIEEHPLRLYRSGALAALFGTDPSTIWRWRKNGTLPPPDAKIGSLEAWTHQLIAGLLGKRGANHV
jgi:hypothetical protein